MYFHHAFYYFLIVFLEEPSNLILQSFITYYLVKAINIYKNTFNLYNENGNFKARLKVIFRSFKVRRLLNSRNFCERARAVFQREDWDQCQNGERE